jgi:hypothetical protein
MVESPHLLRARRERPRRPHDGTSIASFPTTGKDWKLMRRRRRRSFHHGDALLHGLLHLLEGTHAYLAHALARDAELVGELLERDRFFCELPRLGLPEQRLTRAGLPTAGGGRSASAAPQPIGRVETSRPRQSCTAVIRSSPAAEIRMADRLLP